MTVCQDNHKFVDLYNFPATCLVVDWDDLELGGSVLVPSEANRSQWSFKWLDNKKQNSTGSSCFTATKYDHLISQHANIFGIEREMAASKFEKVRQTKK